MADKLNDEEELLSKVRIEAFVHYGKKYESLKEAIESMPMDFWTLLTEEEKDKVEHFLKKYFKENDV
jgi:hypothetical protein